MVPGVVQELPSRFGLSFLAGGEKGLMLPCSCGDNPKLTPRMSHDEERGVQDEYDRAPRHWLNPLRLDLVISMSSAARHCHHWWRVTSASPSKTESHRPRHAGS